jgi:hypothetical protein
MTEFVIVFIPICQQNGYVSFVDIIELFLMGLGVVFSLSLNDRKRNSLIVH